MRDFQIVISPNTPYAVSLIIGSNRYVVLPSYIEEVKAIKNDVEIEGMRNAHIRDGVAMVRWFAWLEKKFGQGHEITEWEASEKLNSFRVDEPKREGAPSMYMGLAYENIVASGANAALLNYNPTRNNAKVITKSEPLLVDSGGQYRDGTCDTTRTVHFGFPSVKHAEAFTRVLQGHIAIETAIFPAGTTGVQLDILARKALWRDGQNYLHGTGHGIGSFLNVHEGPHSFSSTTPLQPGHIITNEPGFYKEGEFGVRIESALLVREVQTKYQSDGDRFLGFERLTQVPIQIKMVRPSLLSMDERQWVTDHNASVRKCLEPYLLEDQTALRWLRQCERAFGNEGSAGRTIEWG
jgi:Xaa-Pro aminopeptidase